MLKKSHSSIFISSLVLCLFACQGDSRVDYNDKETAKIEKIASLSKAEKIKTIFYSLPSPLELTILFKREGVEYHNEELHDPKRRDEYITTAKKALNLGVYGADLSYSGLFANQTDAIQFFSASQTMAENLGIGQTFQREFITRIEKNASNKDTLLQVISDFFLENDIYLKDQNQQDISTYVLVGGWIEGLYLGTHMISEETNTSGIKEIIIGQLNSLDNLIILLNDTGSGIELDKLKGNMVLLREYYNELDYIKLDDSEKEPANDGKEILIDNQENRLEMNDSTFAKISELVTEIRGSIIQ